MSKLARKERKKLSTILTKNLIQLGLKDELVMEKANVQFKVLDLDENGLPQMENGVVKTKLIQRYIAHNPLRRKIRQLRRQERSVSDAFLEMSGMAVKHGEA